MVVVGPPGLDSGGKGTQQEGGEHGSRRAHVFERGRGNIKGGQHLLDLRGGILVTFEQFLEFLLDKLDVMWVLLFVLLFLMLIILMLFLSLYVTFLFFQKSYFSVYRLRL